MDGRTRTRIGATILIGSLLTVTPAAGAAVTGDDHASRAATRCTTPDRPFTPTTLTVPGLTGAATVLALGRDSRGVPKPPPLTRRGKWSYAWDKLSRIRPGSAHGVVRLAAHTYPASGSSYPALGNLLLARLKVGAVLVVRGRDGALQCYRVSQRRTLASDQPMPDYYLSSGAPRLGIVVCSGVRRGPGDWSHRTVWFAKPLGRR